jgi:hypothetical protein
MHTRNACIILFVDYFPYVFSGNTALHLAVMLGRKGNFSFFNLVIIFVQFLLASLKKYIPFKTMIVSEESYYFFFNEKHVKRCPESGIFFM